MLPVALIKEMRSIDWRSRKALIGAGTQNIDTHKERGSYFHLRLADFVQHASRHWACYHHTTQSTSLKARVLSGRWIARHPWPVLKGDWGWKILTGIGGSSGWNSAIERRSWVRARSLVLFPVALFSRAVDLQLSEKVCSSSQTLSDIDWWSLTGLNCLYIHT